LRLKDFDNLDPADMTRRYPTSDVLRGTVGKKILTGLAQPLDFLLAVMHYELGATTRVYGFGRPNVL